jgi:hypothetical protein
MNRILAREAAARRERLLAAIGQRLGSDPNANLRSELQELQMWSWLQASLPASRAAAIFWPALVGLLSLAVVGLAWEWPRGTTRVVLNTSIEELSFRPTADWVWPDTKPVGDAEVSTEEAKQLSLPVANGAVKSDDLAASATLQAGQAKVVELIIASGSTVTLSSSAAEGVWLSVANGEISGGVAASKHITVKWRRTKREAVVAADLDDVDPPETVRFVGGTAAVPTTVKFPMKNALELPAVGAEDLGFAREIKQDPGIQTVVPTVLEGILRLPDTGEEVRLARGDRLVIAGAAGTISRLRLDGSIHLLFEGNARSIKVGPSGFERDFTPSWLDWLYHNQKLLFLWSAVSCVAGLLWSMKGFLRV